MVSKLIRRQKVSSGCVKLLRKETISPYIIQCIVMRLSEKESLDYLGKKGFKISRQHFYRLKKDI
ncbi:hypothetical protein BH18THE1_BH18THE1_09660 [soil metagenome]